MGLTSIPPWSELCQNASNVFLYGGVDIYLEMGQHSIHLARANTASRASITRSAAATTDQVRMVAPWYTCFMSQQPCPACGGMRLRPESAAVTVGGRNLTEVTGMNHRRCPALGGESRGPALNPEQMQIGDEVLKEIRERLQFMLNVGLHYLTLDRPAPTLSGGEGQRIRLASQIGCGLVGVLYILDEPSIGLHSRDNRRLLDTLEHLRDMGNTVLVVEHDAETMRAADWMVDLGPGAGIKGG